MSQNVLFSVRSGGSPHACLFVAFALVDCAERGHLQGVIGLEFPDPVQLAGVSDSLFRVLCMRATGCSIECHVGLH